MPDGYGDGYGFGIGDVDGYAEKDAEMLRQDEEMLQAKLRAKKKGFTPESRASMVERMRAAGLTVMTADGLVSPPNHRLEDPMTEQEPIQVEKKAIDITPYEHGIWCTIEGSKKPFVNEIVVRKWSEDGTQIIFMLDSHNFIFADPEEQLLVVETTSEFYTPEFLARVLAKDRETMEKRP